eukprot:3331153-Pyramimonas_sp.AAC.3
MALAYLKRHRLLSAAAACRRTPSCWPERHATNGSMARASNTARLLASTTAHRPSRPAADSLRHQIVKVLELVSLSVKIWRKCTKFPDNNFDSTANITVPTAQGTARSEGKGTALGVVRSDSPFV